MNTWLIAGIVVLAVVVLYYVMNSRKKVVIDGKEQNCYVTPLGRVRCGMGNIGLGVVVLLVVGVGAWYYMKKTK